MTKPKEISLQRPLRVLQVFRNASLFGKGERSAEESRDWLRWREKKSRSGYIKDGELYLPEKAGGSADINSYGTVLLLDDLSENAEQAVWKDEPNIFAGRGAPIRLLFLQIKTGDTIEIHLKGSEYEWRPRRADYKLCELKQQKPVEIKINGKSDGYHQRYYIEEQLIIEYLGDFNSCKLLPSPAPPVIKKLPGERKIVDARTLLW